ncbi:hypothetical protein DH2020_007846 [Rehmannia glutinosa]|uniref:Retrovirus-related Pol polyprotein from transposon TNT 1-94 n=1 Tax=Rehmannia glutinosa TaxID=99300 RepID=A0ABR0TZM0_REHGL
MSKDELERTQMNDIPCALIVGSLMYAQTCKRPYISFVVGMLGQYQSNPGMDHWKTVNLFLLAGGAILWKSAKQSVIVAYTMETKPLKIYYNNSATVFFSKNDKYSRGDKHMELKYLAIKEVQKQKCQLSILALMS